MNLRFPSVHQSRKSVVPLNPKGAQTLLPGGLRLGLCCQFMAQPIKFQVTTATALQRLPRPEQLRGPYRQWIHEHTFEPHAGGTLARDLVRYAVRLDLLLHRWLVRPDIERIFEFRTVALKKRFASRPNSHKNDFGQP